MGYPHPDTSFWIILPPNLLSHGSFNKQLLHFPLLLSLPILHPCYIRPPPDMIIILWFCRSDDEEDDDVEIPQISSIKAFLVPFPLHDVLVPSYSCLVSRPHFSWTIKYREIFSDTFLIYPYFIIYSSIPRSHFIQHLYFVVDKRVITHREGELNLHIFQILSLPVPAPPPSTLALLYTYILLTDCQVINSRGIKLDEDDVDHVCR